MTTASWTSRFSQASLKPQGAIIIKGVSHVIDHSMSNETLE